MRFLYDLQTRLRLTSPEATAMLALVVAGAVGVGAVEWRERTGVPSADLYATSDAAFEAASRGAPAAARLLASPEASAPSATPNPVPDLAPADTIAPLALSVPVSDAEPTPTEATRPEAGASPVTPSRRSSAKAPGRANLNTGGSAELQRLPGVGPALAQRIMDYRAQNGPFRSVDEVVGVKGIGEKTLEKMRPYAHL